MPVASHPPPGGETDLGSAPRLAQGVALLGEMSHSGFREPPCLVRRADGQMLQLTPLLYRVLEAVDGNRDLASIAAAVGVSAGRSCEAADIEYLIEHKLRPLGVLAEADGSSPAAERANPLLALRFRLVVSKPETTRAITRPFTWLFKPFVVPPVLAAFVGVVAWVLFRAGVGGGLRTILYDPRQLILVFALAALSAGFHEFGHAAACRYGGATPGVMGVGLYLVWPAFYTDVTDSYRLDRRGRLRTDLGGLYFNCVFTLVMAGAAVLTGAEALLVLVPLQLLQMAHQLLPILRLDGYHILADLTGVPDLYARIRPTLRSAVPGVAPDPSAAALRPRVRWVVVAWVAVIVPLLVFGIGSAALAMPRVLATAMDSFGLHWQEMHREWADGQVFAVLARMLSLSFLILPIAGTFLIVERIAARSFRYLWRRFESPPAHTALAGLAVGLVLALLAAWWPRGNYEPLRRDEELRFQELPMVRALTTQDASAIADPLADDPARAGLTDAPGEDSGHFAGTGAVVEGDDNLALAINTSDGASIFRLAFAIRTLTDGVLDHTNTAVAIASCTDCTTIALAFQVVLLFGEAAAVTPENRATALNVACNTCLTFAAATQIVLGFESAVELTEEGRRRIDALHQELLALEARASDLDSETLAAEVAAAEEELLAILEEELVESEPREDAETADGWSDSTTGSEDEEDGSWATTPSTSPTTTSSSTSTSTTSSSTTSTPTTASGA